MKQNDEEIDELLGHAIEKLDRIGMHAQDINTAVNQQTRKLKEVNDHVDRARAGLDKQNSELSSMLIQYRSVSNCCKDLGLFLCLLVLIGCNLAVLKWKGVI